MNGVLERGRSVVAANSIGLKLAAIIGVLMIVGTPVFGQAYNPNGGPSPVVPAAGCAACGAIGIGIIVAIIALNIALLVWVARDSKARGMDSSVLWVFLVLFTGLIGLLIYIFSRPQGALIQCPNCKGKRLQVSAKCPQCGAA